MIGFLGATSTGHDDNQNFHKSANQPILPKNLILAILIPSSLASTWVLILCQLIFGPLKAILDFRSQIQAELETPKVLFKGKLVSAKKANSPFFVHQRHKLKLDSSIPEIINSNKPSSTSHPKTLSNSNSNSKSDQKMNNKNFNNHPSNLSKSQSKSKLISKSQSNQNLSFFSSMAFKILNNTFKFSLLTLIFSLLSSRMITENWFWGYQGKYAQWDYYFPPKGEIFTIESLSYHDGIKDPSKPLLLAINAIVYNVNSNPGMYGPGRTYHHFTGKDATRAFLTGCFKSGLIYDLRGIDDKQKRALNYWSNFYANSPNYPRVGKVILPPIDPKSPIPAHCNPKEEGGGL
ncbi:hypothetical protein O181_106390 [Austropuccinia psidii MF-1]|uniref:Cytochrome b5 heme-binding domain-containing protein n=1 Tax=Austropuccinia psidii MF-1 TaxID=1389203 RepID=A0A9Q3PMN8_9BASI|nr:hypothetical protein [Austropuccinia psidii MF-1]